MFYQYNHLGSADYLKIEKNENFSFPPHLHQCFEIIIILSGQMKITVDGKQFVLEKNDAMLIFPNQIHELESTESEHVLCIFSPRLVQAYSAKITDKIPINNKFFCFGSVILLQNASDIFFISKSLAISSSIFSKSFFIKLIYFDNPRCRKISWVINGI